MHSSSRALPRAPPSSSRRPRSPATSGRRGPHPRGHRGVVPILSVEARQVAWLRDLAGVDPAPRAADPARDAERRPRRAARRRDTSMSAPTFRDIDRDEALTEAIARAVRQHPRRLPAQGGARRRRRCSRRCAPGRRRGGDQRPRDPELRPALRAAPGDLLHAGRGDGHDRLDGRGEAALGADAGRARARAREDHQAGARVQGRAGRPRSTSARPTRRDAAFTQTAVAMEDLTVALLAGVTPQVQDSGLDAALFGLLTVEARHAAWARHIVGSRRPLRAPSTSR